MKIDLSQIIGKFNALPLNARYGVFAGILLAIFVLDVITVINFQWGSLQAIGNENQTLQESIDHLNSDLQRLNQMKDGLQKSRSQLEALNIKIRPLGEVPSILEDISLIANQRGVKIEQLIPQTESPQVLVSSDSVKYYALPIVIQATSGYHMFSRFINQLELANLFFTLGQLTIENRGADINHHNINATLKVVLSDKNRDGQKK